MDKFLFPLLVFFLLASGFYFVKPFFQKNLEKLIGKFIVLPDQFKSLIIPTFFRSVVLNWYCFLFLGILWYVLIKTEIGSDIVEIYLNTLTSPPKWFVPVSFLFLFGCVLLMSLSIWVIPFFLYSDKRRKTISENYLRFYMATKLLGLFAMFPFIIVSNSFIKHFNNSSLSTTEKLLINTGLLLFFFLGIHLSARKEAKFFFDKLYNVFRLHFKVRYLQIMVRIFFWVVLLTLIVWLICINSKSPAYCVALYLFLSSMVVFRLLFYSNEESLSREEIDKTDREAIETEERKVEQTVKELVEKMNAKSNRLHSSWLFVSMSVFVIVIIFILYIMPSLEATSTLYIMLIVFSFYIIYLDFWRNLFRNRTGFWRSVALFAILLFLSTPFLTDRNQFRILLQDMPADIKAKISLDSAIKQRYSYINEKFPDSSVFIVCAMGGGSRAGYITAGVLEQLDLLGVNLWDRTICYSSISGGSVGIYHYLKGRDFEKKPRDQYYLPFIYEKNYNSSGTFGLFIGDAIETVTRTIAPSFRSKLLAGNLTSNGYSDRNQRIRMEYDYILHEALTNTKDHLSESYLKTSFYPLYHKKEYRIVDLFQTYFHQKTGSYPIHFINTFEVNSGRRAVLSPFPASSSSFFPNAVLPLQDKAFECSSERKDITYREAVNLSELFPIVSAASHIGTLNDAQFVDGGYYENYGMTTALDVLSFLQKELLIPSHRIKILLIKNSEQEPPSTAVRNVQILAPLSGIINAPFTGHANHLLAEATRLLPKGNVYPLVFDAKKRNVPLTRSLTGKHIDSMNVWLDELYLNSHLFTFLK